MSEIVQANIKVSCSYEFDGVIYDFYANVIINSHYEVDAVQIMDIRTYDPSDHEIEIEITDLIRNQLEAIAAAKALEKIKPVDFEREKNE